MIINKVTNLYFCFVLVLIVGCTRQSNVQSSSEKKNLVKQSQSKMVYLFFEAEKNNTGEEVVKLVDKKVSDGFFKNEEFGTAKDVTNIYYKILLFDNDNKIFKTSVIDNPFAPVFESYGKESMEKKTGKLTQAEFFYRYNDSGNISKLEIHKSENNNLTLIYTLKL